MKFSAVFLVLFLFSNSYASDNRGVSDKIVDHLKGSSAMSAKLSKRVRALSAGKSKVLKNTRPESLILLDCLEIWQSKLTPSALEDVSFLKNWFKKPSEADKLAKAVMEDPVASFVAEVFYPEAFQPPPQEPSLPMEFEKSFELQEHLDLKLYKGTFKHMERSIIDHKRMEQIHEQIREQIEELQKNSEIRKVPQERMFNTESYKKNALYSPPVKTELDSIKAYCLEVSKRDPIQVARLLRRARQQSEQGKADYEKDRLETLKEIGEVVSSLREGGSAGGQTLAELMTRYQLVHGYPETVDSWTELRSKLKVHEGDDEFVTLRDRIAEKTAYYEKNKLNSMYDYQVLERLYWGTEQTEHTQHGGHTTITAPHYPDVGDVREALSFTSDFEKTLSASKSN